VFVAFVVFSSNDQAAVACSSERVLGGGEMRLLLVICGASSSQCFSLANDA